MKNNVNDVIEEVMINFNKGILLERISLIKKIRSYKLYEEGRIRSNVDSYLKKKMESGEIERTTKKGVYKFKI